MTEQNMTSLPAQGSTAARSAPPTAVRKNRSGLLWVTFTMVLVMALGAGGLYFHQHFQQQQFQQQATNQSLHQQLTELKQHQLKEKTQLASLLLEHNKALETANRQQDALMQQLNALQEKVATISSSDTKIWLLAQADFLVKMAERKLWNDQDATSAVILLKNADTSLADMHDASLIEIRRAIIEDIGTLSTLSQIDFDGIILKLNQLSNQVDNLRLADNSIEDPSIEDGNNQLSSSLSQWRQNLYKSWHNFIADFITIRRRDNGAEPLLAPDQDIYLRENIRARLLIAAQAIPRHQDEVYKQALETSATWIRAYFDVNDANTKSFLVDLDNLSQQSISMNMPDQLKSPPILENLTKIRTRHLLTSTSDTHQEQ
ncbi:uroporphyrinogen-III C-methyltransferase [Candidatus Regiella insecticola]|uniref:Putative uroporphyrinogen-III C-methyltransferase n=1 Tax=Candidatus Regiella insecticola TaxID=138073 RepID=A0A6L2ZP07_9ENTR|nr:uroporphyrinogen-III C-methyltransferase [Candidatus Regiella insecticola]GFN46513.1 putative uroporphyrinogen-III C-methyltransferase [Candidatus Regiella insecticola]